MHDRKLLRDLVGVLGVFGGLSVDGLSVGADAAHGGAVLHEPLLVEVLGEPGHDRLRGCDVVPGALGEVVGDAVHGSDGALRDALGLEGIV